MRRRRTIFGWFVLILFIAGCSPQTKFGTISGTVTDIDGNSVIGAEVYAEVNGSRRITRTVQNGTFYLNEAPQGFTPIYARIQLDGRWYTGRQIAQVFEGEQSQNINLMIAPLDQQGMLEGYVSDFNRRAIEGARVFAGGALSAAMAVTDKNGFYRIEGLPSGYDYPVVASKPGFVNVTQNARITRGSAIPLSFTLNLSINESVNPPANLSATAWTFPRNATRSQSRQAYEAIQQWLEPHRKPQAKTRATGNSFIEIDLHWDYEAQRSLLGYGIYRGRNVTELRTNAIAFLRDPLADFYADFDEKLQANVNYLYEMVALNTDYLDDLPGSASARSERASAMPFQEITLNAPTLHETVGHPFTIAWSAVSGANYYQVAIYDRFPDYLIDPIYPADLDNPGASRVSAPQTSLVYSGPRLASGRTHYVVVIAANNSGTARALTPITAFRAR